MERIATVRNSHGIHCRPSAEIVGYAKNCTCTISLTSQNGNSDLRSVLGLVSLGLEQGQMVSIQVDGPDEQGVCERLVELFEHHFDFPPKE